MNSGKKSVRFANNSQNEIYLVNSSHNSSKDRIVADIFLSVLNKTIKDNIRESLNNYSNANVLLNKKEFQGTNVVLDVSTENTVQLINKMRNVLSLGQFPNRFTQQHINDEQIMNELVSNIDYMKNKSFLDYLIKSFSLIKDVQQGVDPTSVILLKLFYQTAHMTCTEIQHAQDDVIDDIKKMLKYKFGLDKTRFLYIFARHVREALECPFGDNLYYTAGGGDVSYKIHHGRRYKVHVGKKGGRYIMVKGVKKYV
jgi:hypothetical protein